MKRIVIVGASLAGNRLAERLRELGFDGPLTVVGTEPHHPYDRYPLSKSFLSGELDRSGLDLPLPQADIAWKVATTATGVDLADRAVLVDSGERLPFDGLAVTSGARPRDVSWLRPGTAGVHVLRTVDDAIALRGALTTSAGHLVIVGGGLIGAEVASTAAGLGHRTTMLDGSDLPMSRAVGSDVAAYLLARHLESGVRVRRRARVAAIDTEGGHVTGIVLGNGERMAADAVVVATGTRPNTEWLAGSGLKVDDGLVCESTLHAQGTDRIVGAGDVACVPHPLLDDELARVEHWSTALDQAALAAENLLCGVTGARPFAALPGFGTTIHGTRIRSLGFPRFADRGRVVWGSLGSGEAVVALGRGDRLIGMVSVNAHERLYEMRALLDGGAAFADASANAGGGTRRLP